MIGDPKKRLDAGQALNHEWFKIDIDDTPIAIDTQVLNRLQNFKGVSKLKKAAMNMLVKMADAQSIENLRSQFEQMDIDKTGLINADELKTAISNNKDIHLTEQEI